MKLTYLNGFAVEEKTAWMMKQIKKMIIADPESAHIIVVPEQFTLEAEKQYLKHTQEKGLFNVEVLSFSRLAHRVFLETGGKGRVTIDDLGIHMILKKIMKENSDTFLLYHTMAHQKGFIETLAKEIAECKQYEITPEMLMQQAELNKENPNLHGKLKDLSLIFQRCNQALEGKYLRKEDQLAAFRKQAEHSHWLKNKHLWIEGFYSFTPNLLSAVKTLLTCSKSVTMSVYGNQSEDVKESVSLKKQLLDLAAYAKAIKIDQKNILMDDLIEPREKPGEIKHLAAHFFDMPVVVYEDEPSSLAVFNAINDESELAFVAKKIQHLVQHEGYQYKDIAVICPNLQERQHDIKRIFQLHQIPGFIDEKTTAKNHPLMRLMIHGLEAVQYNYPQQYVLSYLKTGLSLLSHEEIEELENISAEYGITGNKWHRDLTTINPDLEDYEPIRKRGVEPLKQLEIKLKKAPTVKEKTRAMYEWLTNLNIVAKIEAQTLRAKTDTDFEQSQVNAQIWNHAMKLFDQMVELMGDETTSIEEYTEVLKTGIEAIEIGTIPTTLDQVFIGTLERSRVFDIKGLFIISLNDGVIPANKTPDTLLLPSERMALAEKGIVLGTQIEDRETQEMIYIYLAATKPSQYLWLTYSMADHEGNANRPSLLIEQLTEMYPQLQIQDDLMNTTQRQLESITQPQNTFQTLTEYLRKLTDHRPAEEIWFDVYNWFYKNPDWHQKSKSLVEGLFYRNNPEPIPELVAKGLYGKPLRGSVARLEKFQNCPFMHFVQYGLKPKERKTFEIQPVEMGDYLHLALDEFAAAVKNENKQWHTLTDTDCDDLMDRIMDPLMETFKHNVFLSTKRNSYLGNRMKQLGKKTVKTMVKQIQQGQFIPTYHEVKFGGDGELDPLEITDGKDPIISLQGRIDRIDLYKKDGVMYYRVIDYKTGNKELKVPEIYYGLQLQLPVYLQAILEAKNVTEKEKQAIAGMFYYHLDDPMMETTETDPAKIQEEIYELSKLRGIALKDKEVVAAMDQHMATTSHILPISFKKDGDFSAASDVATEEAFTVILSHVKNTIAKSAQSIIKGNIAVFPYEYDHKRPCTYCDYISICQFDHQLDTGSVNYLKKLNKNEALALMQEKAVGKEDA